MWAYKSTGLIIDEPEYEKNNTEIVPSVMQILCRCCWILHVQPFSQSSTSGNYRFPVLVSDKPQASSSSSADPGIFVVCQQVSLLNWWSYRTWNRKYIFLCAITWTERSTISSFDYIMCFNVLISVYTETVLLPRKVSRIRQRLVEVLFAHQPISGLNTFSLRIHNYKQSFAKTTQLMLHIV